MLCFGLKLTSALHVPVSALVYPHVIFDVHLYLSTVCTVVKCDLLWKQSKKRHIMSERVCFHLLKHQLGRAFVTNHYVEVVAVWQLVVAHSLQIDGFQGQVDAHW